MRIPWKVCSMELGTSKWKHGFSVLSFIRKTQLGKFPVLLSGPSLTGGHTGTGFGCGCCWELVGPPTGWQMPGWSLEMPTFVFSTGRVEIGGWGGRGEQKEEHCNRYTHITASFLYISLISGHLPRLFHAKCLCAFAFHCIVNARLWPLALMVHTSLRPWGCH